MQLLVRFLTEVLNKRDWWHSVRGKGRGGITCMRVIKTEPEGGSYVRIKPILRHDPNTDVDTATAARPRLFIKIIR